MISRREFRASQGELKSLLDRIEVALLVRDPGSAKSAEAYDGLRKTVAASARDRRQHLVQLAELADAIEREATIETLRQRTAEWCAQAGLVRVDEFSDPEWFEITGGEGDVLVVDAPAWVDQAASSVVKRGLASRANTAPAPSAGLEDATEPGDESDTGEDLRQ